MNCAQCQSPNVDSARFCTQCGSALAQTASPAAAMPISAAPAVPVSGNGKNVLIVLAVVFGLLLALAVGIYAAFRTVVNKVSALGSSLGGAHRHDPVDFHTLEALLPSALPGMQRAEPRGSSNQAMGIKTASADVDFHGPDNASINVSIKDATAVSGLAGLAAMADADESEQGDSYEKNESIDGHSVHEKWDAQGRHGLLSLIVARRFGVDLEGNNVDMAALKSALAQIDLGKLESMKDVNPQAQ